METHVTGHESWRQQLDRAVQTIDPEVVSALPRDASITGIAAHGASLWTRTARLDAQVNKVPTRFFLKVAHGEAGRKTLGGEFASMKAIQAITPDFVPQPLALGRYQSLDNVHFLVCEFRDMKEGLPDVDRFTARVAHVHKHSASPTGKFGFDRPTSHGTICIDHGWSDTWEGYFSRTTRALLSMEQDAQGPDDEIARLGASLLEKVLPRLLRPLETGGRTLRPVLLHGDLWHGNAATDVITGEPIIFDSAGFYGHHEYELAVWRQPWNEMSKGPFVAKYLEHFPASEPRKELEARGLVYATRVNILDSILYREEKTYREMLRESLRGLVERFGRDDGES